MRKQEESARKYKIGMAVREAGVSPQTVRFYEKRDLMGSLQEDTGSTRYYGVRHLKQLSNIRRYFKLGFSEEEIHGIMDCRDLTEFSRIFEKRLQENREEQARLRLQEEMLGGLQEQLAMVPRLLHRVEIAENPPLCFLINRTGGEMLENAAVEEVQSRWVGQIHLTSIASVIPQEVFLHEPDSHYRLSGYCLPQKYLSLVGSGSGDRILRFYPAGKCLHTCCVLQKEERSPAALMPEAYAFLQKENCTVTGDVFGRLIAVLGERGIQTENEPSAAYYEYWIPIL